MFVYYKARIIALLCSLALADGDPIRAGTACAIDSVIQALQSNGSAATSYCKSLARGSELTVTAMATTTITSSNTTITKTVTQDLTITFTDVEDIAVIVTTYQPCLNKTSITSRTTRVIQEDIDARDVKIPACLAPYQISSACKRYVAAPTTTTTKTSMETATLYVPTMTELYTVLGNNIVQEIVTIGNTYTDYVTSCT